MSKQTWVSSKSANIDTQIRVLRIRQRAAQLIRILFSTVVDCLMLGSSGYIVLHYPLLNCIYFFICIWVELVELKHVVQFRLLDVPILFLVIVSTFYLKWKFSPGILLFWCSEVAILYLSESIFHMQHSTKCKYNAISSRIFELVLSLLGTNRVCYMNWSEVKMKLKRI